MHNYIIDTHKHFKLKKIEVVNFQLCWFASFLRFGPPLMIIVKARVDLLNVYDNYNMFLKI